MCLNSFLACELDSHSQPLKKTFFDLLESSKTKNRLISHQNPMNSFFGFNQDIFATNCAVFELKKQNIAKKFVF